jgi:hypothetical protein
MIVADTLTFDSVVKFIMEDMFNRPVNTRARTRVISKNHTVLDLEFWEPKYAQDWVDILNAEFDPQAEPASEEKRRYPAYWVNKEVYYAIGEDTYRVKVVPRIQVRTNGYVDLQDDRLQMFHYEEGGSFQFTQHNAGPSEKLRKDVDSGDRLS